MRARACVGSCREVSPIFILACDPLRRPGPQGGGFVMFGQRFFFFHVWSTDDLIAGAS